VLRLRIYSFRTTDTEEPRHLEAYYLGVNVMIAIFDDFHQFSAKKWRFSLKQCYDQFLSKRAAF
jgi:hypothetical protein